MVLVFKRIGLERLGLLVGALFLANVANAGLITNGDFETGNLTGWTTFLTDNGTIGSPTVTSFDTTGSGGSLAAQFNVGQLVFSAGNPAGGGISQSIDLAVGSYSLSAAVATNVINTNASGGIFELLFNDVVVDSFDSGNVSSSDPTQRELLMGTIFAATAGWHEVSMRMTRPFTISDVSDDIPSQYVDNVLLIASVPEPSSLALIALGLAGFGFAWRKRAT